MQGNLLVPFLEGLEAAMPPGYSARGWCAWVTKTRPLTLQRAKSESVGTGGELRSASQGEGHTARISTTDDGSTHPLAERLKPEPFRTQKEVAVLGILAERVGINEVS